VYTLRAGQTQFTPFQTNPVLHLQAVALSLLSARFELLQTTQEYIPNWIGFLRAAEATEHSHCPTGFQERKLAAQLHTVALNLLEANMEELQTMHLLPFTKTEVESAHPHLPNSGTQT